MHIPDPVNFIATQKGYAAAESETVEVAPWTREFVDILEAIQKSEFYTPEPDEACVFVPPVVRVNSLRSHGKGTWHFHFSQDLLNEDALRLPEAAGKALSSYPEWNGGENNLVFNLLPAARGGKGGSSLGVSHGKAMVAGAGMDDSAYRSGFDISLPTFSPFVQLKPALQKEIQRRRWTLLSSQINASPGLKEVVESVLQKENDVLVLSKCPALFDSKDDDVRCAEDGGDGLLPYAYPQVKRALP